MYNFNTDGYSMDQNIVSSNKLLRSAFVYMVLGLFVTFSVPTYILFFNPSFLMKINQFFFPIIISEFIIVIGLSTGINKISKITAAFMFFIYSFLNGLIFSLIGAAYSLNVIFYSLLTTIIMFIVLSIYGYTTKEDLGKYQGFLKTGLISLIIISIINLFLNVPSLYWIVTVLGVVIFSALICFDVNRIKKMAYQISSGDEEALGKMGIIGALSLYLDFINLFLYLLRIFSRRK